MQCRIIPSDLSRQAAVLMHTFSLAYTHEWISLPPFQCCPWPFDIPGDKTASSFPSSINTGYIICDNMQSNDAIVSLSLYIYL